MDKFKFEELTFAAVAGKIAYACIFTGVILCYVVVTIRPPVSEMEGVPLEGLPDDTVASYTTRMLTYGDFIDAVSNCQEPDIENKYCYLLPPDDIMSIKPPVMLENYRNPCWEVPEDYLEGPPIRCLPHFFLIGAPKSGTTDMYERMSRHPQISGMVKKELHWFTKRRYTYKTPTKLPQAPYFSNYTDLYHLAIQDIYDNEVENGYHKKIVGDNSVSTLWDNSYVVKYNEIAKTNLSRVAAAIHHLNPNTKFISIIRDPVERTYSDFLFFNSEEKKSQEKFHRLVIEGINYHQSCLRYMPMRDCLDRRPGEQKEVRLWVGMYVHYFEEYFESFTREQFYIIKLEDYAPNISRSLVEIFDFLGLDPLDAETFHTVSTLGAVVNKQARKIGEMFPETKKLLEEFYRPYNEKLAELLGEEFNYNKYHNFDT